MRRVMALIALLGAGLVLALFIRVRQLRAESHGPAGGSGVVEGIEVHVTSRIPTRIAKVLVREGDLVKAGQLLVELDCSEAEAALDEASSRLHAAEAGLTAARANAKAAGRTALAAADNISASQGQLAALEAQELLAGIDLGRVERLLDARALSLAARDDARARHDTLINQISAQRSSAAAARNQADALGATASGAVAQALAAEANGDAARAGVARADVGVRECKLVAPRDGMVATRALEPGEAVQPGSVLLTLTDVSEARTRFYLPNDALAAAALGRKVRVVADAYPGEIFHGTIFYVSPRAEFTPRNVQTRADRERLVYEVEVRVPNADLRLREGMPVEVAIEGTSQ